MYPPGSDSLHAGLWLGQGAFGRRRRAGGACPREDGTSSFPGRPRAYPDHNLPDNGEVFFAYDAAQRMTRRTDQVPDNTAFVYDRANRLTQRTYPDSLNDAFTYDQANRLLTATSARYNNVVTRVYDDASRMTSETLTVGGQNFPVQSAYDAANRRTNITYPDGKVVAQAFTDRDQLSSVSYDGSNVATLAYDVGMRQTTKTFVNGKVETRTYRADNRLTQIQTPGVTDFTFTYDANKNPLTKNFALDTSDNQTYTYDAEDRLTNFARQSGFNQNWTLSLVGDWSAFNNNGSVETRTHNNVHELTAINAGSLAYDLKGNLTSNSNGQGYTWDFENLMKTAQVGADTANYEYDAFRRRVKKTFQGSSTVFVYDGWRCVAEYENGASASSPARDFVFGTYLDEPLMMVTAPAGAATKRYYHSDHLYSIYALTDAAGAVVERYRYTAYGQATVLTAGFVAKADPNYSEFGSPWTYTGQRLDAETSLHYYKNRYYSAGLGRFVGRDPIGYRGSKWNLYEYLRGQMIRRVDSIGQGSAEVNGGTIEWEIAEHKSKNGAVGTFKFIPKDGCCCKQIAFVQVVIQMTMGGKIKLPGYEERAPDYLALVADPKTGGMVDLDLGDVGETGETDPYFDAEWDEEKKTWKSEDEPDNQMGSCDPRKNATMQDNATNPFVRSGQGDAVFKYEACAFCIDTQEVLGCVTWGYEIPDKAGSEVKLIDEGAKKTASDGPGGFKKAVQKYNEVADKNQRTKIGDPKNTPSGKNMGGASALK